MKIIFSCLKFIFFFLIHFHLNAAVSTSEHCTLTFHHPQYLIMKNIQMRDHLFLQKEVHWNENSCPENLQDTLLNLFQLKRPLYSDQIILHYLSAIFPKIFFHLYPKDIAIYQLSTIINQQYGSTNKHFQLLFSKEDPYYFFSDQKRYLILDFLPEENRYITYRWSLKNEPPYPERPSLVTYQHLYKKKVFILNQEKKKSDPLDSQDLFISEKFVSLEMVNQLATTPEVSWNYFQATADLPVGSILLKHQFRKLMLVNPSSPTTYFHLAPQVKIKMEGSSLQIGGIGDQVSIRLKKTGKIISGFVTGKNEVSSLYEHL
jgi:hypothetical protein